MDSSPTTASARPGSSVSRLGVQPSPTILWSRRRSTSSPLILPPISMSTGFSPYRDKRRQHEDDGDEEAVGAAIKLERSADVGGIGLAPPVAHPGAVGGRAGISARTGEGKSERAGHGRLGITGIGRSVFGAVPPRRLPRP